MKTTLRASILAAAIAALPFGASAAGLGRLNVFSGLGQPLRAEVEVTGSAEELESLNARLASPDAFRRANIEYAPQLTSLRLSVERRGAGAVVKVSSDRAFNEPFVDLLLELNWTGGRLLREYTFLLDPIDETAKTVAPEPAAPVARPLEPKAAASKHKEKSESVERPKSQAQETKPAPKRDIPGSEYTVKQGDSLTAIANRTKASDVSLEQMLAALYAANETAFAGGDINRLRAGQVLKVPDAGDARAISSTESKKILSAPSANFGAYRQKAAAAVAEAPAKDTAPKQSSSGKITPKVEDAAKPQAAKDQLKISKSQVAKEPEKADAKSAGRIQALEEDLVARERALKEASERVAALEKNVKDLQKLVDLKNQNLADLQKQAAAAKADAAKQAEAKAKAATPEKEPVAKPEPVAEKPKAEESAPVKVEAQAPAPVVDASAPPAQVKPPVVEASAPKKPVPPPPAPVEVEEPGVFASLLDNPALLGGLAAVLGLGGFLAWRSRKPKRSNGPDTTALNATQTGIESVIGPAGGQTVDTGSSVLPTDFSQSGLTSIDADEGVDPVAEADVYMAYGRDAQAEEILLDALKSDPGRTAIHVKLLEIYAQRKSLKQFENIATDLYTQTAGIGNDWARAADLGAKLDPDNPLYRTSAKSAPVASEPAMLDELSFVEAGNAVAPEVEQDQSGFEPMEVETPADLPDALEFTPAQAPTTPAFAAASPSQMQTTWTMPGEIGQITRSLEGDAQTPAAEPAVASSDDLGLDFNLDLDMVQSAPVEVAVEPEVGSLPDLGPDEITAAEVKLTTTNLGGGASDQPITLDLDGFGASPASQDDVAVASTLDSQQEALVDLEKTNFEGGLLDFDFDVDRSPQTLSPAAEPAPLDLSGIDLELPQQSVSEAPRQSEVDTHPEPQVLEDDFEMGDEVNTKLELARAYEEMRDYEGAKELLEEVLSEGSSAQKDEAQAMLARLS
ncbi:FimV/HubP family polar landmark protein [Niveibacterium umoris]|uniref:Pilus assembly protein FimV n=1 Tax=Niveibacterium umoris TaxID=1193620 RepID=A0A840BHJ1_9RHOO|nr:FimV/HubP family polar landmark protein [Niveibacterium umoris]MBB4012113.1 pilus assembly protein FimV [Niveibacterium umoris]